MVTETPSCANPNCDQPATEQIRFYGRVIGHTCDGCLCVALRTDREDLPFGAVLAPSEDTLRFAMPVDVRAAMTAAELDDLVAIVRRVVADGAEAEVRAKWAEVQEEAP